jgi:regulator of protease activity HflC (stomatin/prohibitin superfamily)
MHDDNFPVVGQGDPPRPRPVVPRRPAGDDVFARPGDGGSPEWSFARTLWRFLRNLSIGAFLLIVLIGAALFVWYGCRIEVDTGHIAVLIRKTGKVLPADAIVAPDADHQGIQLDVLAEGRYFYNPYSWDWRIGRVTDVPAGKLGVLTRQYGAPPPPGRIAAGDGEKGIVAEPLLPGKHRVNPLAYTVEFFDAITIRPGCAGVVARLDGADVLAGELPAGAVNVLTVPEGIKGVQTAILDPGTYYLNPYIHGVTEVNLQSQRFELSGDDAISFLTQDGFTVVVEGTLEFALERARAPVLTHQIGDMDDILKKIILPRARGFSRIEGSKHPAINFIAGETRQNFQNALEKHLKTQCERWGVDIRSMLIRNITPPDDIAGIIREREVALQNQKKIDQQIVQAKSKAELTRQEMLAVQNMEKVEAETLALRARIEAEQEREVYLTAAQRNLAVAKIDLDAAKLQAEAILIAARADQTVVARQNQADANVVRAQTEAFGGGTGLARYTLYQRIAPRIDSILSTDVAPGLGGVFGPFMPGAAGFAPRQEDGP